MTLRVGINGFGRIGRTLFRALATGPDSRLVVAAVNDTADPGLLAHLLAYDTRLGRWPGRVDVVGDHLLVNGRLVPLGREADPGRLDWSALDVDVVVEATGRFRERAAAARHLDAGARSVVVSAPMPDADLTVLYGLNHTGWDPVARPVISAGSCTAHAVAPLITTLRDGFGWDGGYMTTVHPVTPDQRTADGPHADWRRARAAGGGVLPTSSSAVSVIREVLPDVASSFGGMAYRVPTLSPGVVDLTVRTRARTTPSRVLDAFDAAAATLPPGILAVGREPLVGADYMGDLHSAVVDADMVDVVNGTQVHVVAWYDNETGYAQRLADLLRHLAVTHALRPAMAASPA